MLSISQTLWRAKTFKNGPRSIPGRSQVDPKPVPGRSKTVPGRSKTGPRSIQNRSQVDPKPVQVDPKPVQGRSKTNEKTVRSQKSIYPKPITSRSKTCHNSVKKQTIPGCSKTGTKSIQKSLQNRSHVRVANTASNTHQGIMGRKVQRGSIQNNKSFVRCYMRQL